MGNIKPNYDVMKTEIKDFKQKLIDYFKKPSFDVTLNQLVKYFKLSSEELNSLQFCVDELVKEGFVNKSSSLDHYEYGPGKKLNSGEVQ